MMGLSGFAEHTLMREWRQRLVLVSFVIGAGVLLWRIVDLQTYRHRPFLLEQADLRHVRAVKVPAHRGMIVDRHDQPLAISTPVDSVWVNPEMLVNNGTDWTQLAQHLAWDPARLGKVLSTRKKRQFLYIRRHVLPEVAQRVRDLKIPGVYLEREYRRYYPGRDVASHLIGFTDVDDLGLEGLELAYNDWLTGIDGTKYVVQDRRGQSIEDIEYLTKVRNGRTLKLSIDLRIQTLAHRALEAATKQHGAKNGSIIVLDSRSGEILAMTNQPGYNANDPKQRTGARTRNRAITDVLEPGSVVKPFTIAAALETTDLRPDTPINTSPGTMRVGRHRVQDRRNYGLIDVRRVLELSSNVGASQIALKLMAPRDFWETLINIGVGARTGVDFPGEAIGSLINFEKWGDIHMATLAFGYGMALTPLQLAQAYAAIANDGLLLPPSFLVRTEPATPRRVFSERVAGQVRTMLEGVVERGTGRRAQIRGYRVGGKTGTARKAVNGGYAKDRYNAIFAGIAPLSAPRFVLVVVLDELQGKEYYGGQVAAPVFAEVMEGALRLLNIAPDRTEVIPHRIRLADLSPGEKKSASTPLLPAEYKQ